MGPSASPPLALIINFDAELELALGLRHTRKPSFKALFETLTRTYLAPVWPNGSIFVLDEQTAFDKAGVVSFDEARRRTAGLACAWCPTERAHRLASSIGLTLGQQPTDAALSLVNERGFALALGDVLVVDRVTTIEGVNDAIRRKLEAGPVLVKHGLSASGRGTRAFFSPPTVSESHGLARALRQGALYVEPFVDIVSELSVHGWIVANGGVYLTSVRRIHTNSQRHYVGSERLREGTIDFAFERELLANATQTGEALRGAGYFGPFGIDAFVYRTSTGQALRPRSEINARYCMNWDESDGFLGPATSD